MFNDANIDFWEADSGFWENKNGFCMGIGTFCNLNKRFGAMHHFTNVSSDDRNAPVQLRKSRKRANKTPKNCYHFCLVSLEMKDFLSKTWHAWAIESVFSARRHETKGNGSCPACLRSRIVSHIFCSPILLNESQACQIKRTTSAIASLLENVTTPDKDGSQQDDAFFF